MGSSKLSEGISVTFPPLDLSKVNDFLYSRELDISGTGVKPHDVGNAVVGSVCVLCPHKGESCNPKHLDVHGAHNVVLDNVHVDQNGLHSFELFPNDCPLPGHEYIYKYDPNNPSNFELIPAPDASQDSTNALS